MASNTQQTTIVQNKLYKLEGQALILDQGKPNIEVQGGTVSIYGSQKLPVGAPSNMVMTVSGFSGMDIFNVVPNYLFVTGNATSIILSGMSAKEVV